MRTIPTAIPSNEVLERPNAARIYDYYLNGFHNFDIDRKAGDEVSTLFPDIRSIAWVNRAFLGRVVRFLLAQGIDQFLDIGSGLPTVGNVHEAAQRGNPAARVVYVDSDPVVVIHSDWILRDNPYACTIQADARDPEQILAHPQVQQLLDFDQPAAVMLVAVLHLIPDDAEVLHTVRVLQEALAPGSYLVMSHQMNKQVSIDELVWFLHSSLYVDSSEDHPVGARSLGQIATFFEGMDLVAPGLVYLPQWQPESPHDRFLDEPERSAYVGGVGRKL